MRKPLIRLYKQFNISTLSPNFEPLAIFDGCTVRLVSDLIGNPKDEFYHDAADMVASVGNFQRTTCASIKDNISLPLALNGKNWS